MRWQFSILLALAVSTRTAAQTAQRADLPMNAAPVFKPCTDQPRTTKAFIASYSRGRAPTRADLTSFWMPPRALSWIPNLPNWLPQWMSFGKIEPKPTPWDGGRSIAITP